MCQSFILQSRKKGSCTFNQVVFGREWPLPSWLYGESDVTEGYDERAGEYTIDVQVKNRLFGTLFTYKSRFTERVSTYE
ncbi:DUF4166 domain-containing protein [Bacillus aerius]|uniref:DUF4166 domain-containing protein n=1 Tax=Bacillus aerius TaxID=293388 RepID=UPI00359470D6